MRLSTTRVLVLTGLVLALAVLMGWARQFIPGSTPLVVEAQTKGKQTLDAARTALDRAISNEKLIQTKESALAVEDAREVYNAAVVVRVAEINASLSELRAAGGKTPSVVLQIAALEAELRELEPPAGPIPAATPETEPNNTSATANAIDLSAAAQPCAIVSAAINPGGDLDFFTFTAPAGSRVWIETDTGGTQNAGATSRDTVIDLIAADGVTVIENDDDDGTGNGGDGTIETSGELASMIGGRTLTAGGTYFIRVRGFSATGIVDPYRLFVTLTNVAATAEVEANNTAATANTIVIAGSPIGLRSGAIGAAGDLDYYSVVATAGNIVYFNCDADPERDGTGTDLVVEVRDPADVLLLSVDSSITGGIANPAAEGANFTIAVSGTYFIRVRHFSATGTGTYHLMVSACSGDAVGGGGCTSITCPANVTQTNDPNQCGAVVTYPAPTPSGSCGTINCSPASGSFFPVGTTTVTCTSSAGPSCTFTVTVTDGQPPSITCPANITTLNDPNQCGAVVTYPPPTITDNCPGTFTATCNPPSGSFFPVGTTTVTCSVNVGSRSVIPQGACSAQTITQSTSQAITSLNSVSCNDGFGHTDNSYFRAFTLSSFGITNAFDVQSVDIGIEDAISGGARPVKGASKGGSQPSGASKSSISYSSRVSAPAGTGQPLTVNIYTSSMPFPTGFPGSLTLIGTANTNVADQSLTILNVPITGTAGAGSQLVVEVFTPSGEAAGNLFFIGSNAAPETGPSYFRAAACGINNPTTTAAIGFPNMHIVLNVNGCQQVVGGGSTCTFTVTVNDTQPPVITCPPNQTVVTNQNGCAAAACQVVNFPAPVASDNCPGVTVVCTPPSGSCSPTGVTTVTCTATDASGNTATCSFSLTTFDTALQDDSDPSIILLWNSISGQYRFCCRGTTYTGVGKPTRQGCVYTLDHTNSVDKRVLGRVDKSVHAGTASIQAPGGTARCTITDRNTLNDSLTPACQ